ncbi:hypothetical protein J437_LFUL001245 [Ladona fulva]|uniref:RRM domain-containing protein n=1 Tax=Ladona fulva TaxID=123851 RepID=A0A8K0JVE7_LADFU|nr:hypothetical protein J437_LFUL001245 [Ladona fulva]
MRAFSEYGLQSALKFPRYSTHVMALCKSDNSRKTEGDLLNEQLTRMELSTRRLLDLTNRTHYSISQVNGQRTYGPPPFWRGDPPGKDCEIFVGRIPRDCFEDELIPVLETAGVIYEFRLMMDFSGSNRGFGFALYSKSSEARRAIALLNKYEIRPGCTLGIVKSMNNCNLFIGGLELDVTEDEIMLTLKSLTSGVLRVNFHLYKSGHLSQGNKKYVLVEYETHRAAAMARRVLVPYKMRFRGSRVVVDWANPFGEDLQRFERNGYAISPDDFKEKTYFDARNKSVKKGNRQGRSRRATVPPRYAREVSELSFELDRMYFGQDELLHSSDKNQYVQYPSLDSGRPAHLQTSLPLPNSSSPNHLSLNGLSLNDSKNQFLIIPQYGFPPTDFALQQIMVTAYHAQMIACCQRDRQTPK